MMDANKLKPGDEVAWRRRYQEGPHGAARPWRVTTVKRVMATQIVTADGLRWTKKHGFEVAGGTNPATLHEVTPEIKQSSSDFAEQEALRDRFSYEVAWKGLDLATLRRVKAALDGEAVPS